MKVGLTAAGLRGMVSFPAAYIYIYLNCLYLQKQGGDQLQRNSCPCCPDKANSRALELPVVAVHGTASALKLLLWSQCWALGKKKVLSAMVWISQRGRHPTAEAQSHGEKIQVTWPWKTDFGGALRMCVEGCACACGSMPVTFCQKYERVYSKLTFQNIFILNQSSFSWL